MSPSQLVQVVPPGIYRRPNNPSQDPSGWYAEETLDVESVHGRAPAARIVFVDAPNNYQDLDAAMNHVVDRGLAQIITNSYGFPTELLPPGYVKPLNDTFIQSVDASAGTADRLRTFDDYSGSPTQFTGPGWDRAKFVATFCQTKMRRSAIRFSIDSN